MTESSGYPTFDFDQVDFVTSGTHFGRARISELAGRPFHSVEEMDAELVRRWNATVGPDDVVLHLGDVALGSIQHSLPLTAGLHGRRFLVPGKFHVGVDAFGFTPIPFELIDAWLADLQSEEREMAAIVRD